MTTAHSLHIGLNHVSPAAYSGWDGALAGCINDAKDMNKIAKGLGYTSVLLTDADATSDRVIYELGKVASLLKSGDILFVTYSGHGGQVKDVNGDEKDGLDETWCLWDRQFIDDELYRLWVQFELGVRIVVLSDSCHSGTVIRAPALAVLAARTRKEEKRSRRIPRNIQDAVNSTHEIAIAAAQYLAGPSERVKVPASIILISGCQDQQESGDGSRNGVFTEKLKATWDNGAFEGTYRDFYEKIKSNMPDDQTPNYLFIGEKNEAFQDEKPFKV